MESILNLCGYRQSRYAMKKHAASRLHYDLRLQWNETVLSFALPADFGYRIGMICEATEMPDHRPVNLLFEGLHQTGTIMLWDKGVWEPHRECDDIKSSLRGGYFRFLLRGEKLQGDWTLRLDNRKSGSRSVWKLFMQAPHGTYADVLRTLPNSIDKGRTMEEIAQAWKYPPKRYAQQTKLFDWA